MDRYIKIWIAGQIDRQILDRQIRRQIKLMVKVEGKAMNRNKLFRDRSSYKGQKDRRIEVFPHFIKL